MVSILFYMDPHILMYLLNLTWVLAWFAMFLMLVFVFILQLGESMVVTHVYLSRFVVFMGFHTLIDLVTLDMQDLDVILGMT